MNVSEFKRELEGNKKKNLSNYLKEHKKVYNETLEEAIDRILKEKTKDIDLNEPFILNLLSKQKKDEHKWLDCKYYYAYKEYCNHSDFETKKTTKRTRVKRLVFGTRLIEKVTYLYRPITINKSVSYQSLPKIVKERVLNILKDKGFFTIDKHFITTNTSSYGIHTTSYYELYVYWNKEQYETVLKDKE